MGFGIVDESVMFLHMGGVYDDGSVLFFVGFSIFFDVLGSAGGLEGGLEADTGGFVEGLDFESGLDMGGGTEG